MKDKELAAHYRAALEQIIRMRHTPRAYRHKDFEKLVKIASDALRDNE